MPELPPELTEDGPPPGATWFGKLLAYLRSCRVVIGRDSGLTATSGPDGVSIALVKSPFPAYARVTEEIGAFDPATDELGVGKAMIRQDKDGVLTDTGVEVAVKNDIMGSVVVGKQIKIVWMGASYAVFTASCPTTP